MRENFRMALKNIVKHGGECNTTNCLGIKNYLFAGSHEAAQQNATLYSRLGGCKLHNVNPFNWMKDVLSRISTCPLNEAHELLPQNWKITHADL